MKLPTLVKKRSGYLVKFDKDKIHKSLVRTLIHIKLHSHELIEQLTDEVINNIAHLDKETVTVDEIREIVVKTLTRHSLERAAHAYDFVFLNVGSLAVKKVIKRDGREVEFHPYKIFKGIKKSLHQAGIEDPLLAETLTKGAVHLIEEKFGKEGIVPVENIKETVEYELVRHKLGQAARFYILDRYL